MEKLRYNVLQLSSSALVEILQTYFGADKTISIPEHHSDLERTTILGMMKWGKKKQQKGLSKHSPHVSL